MVELAFAPARPHPQVVVDPGCGLNAAADRQVMGSDISSSLGGIAPSHNA